MSALQRYRDWRHKRRIRQLRDECKAAMRAGDKSTACLRFAAMAGAISRRSPEQVARMERKILARGVE